MRSSTPRRRGKGASRWWCRRKDKGRRTKDEDGHLRDIMVQRINFQTRLPRTWTFVLNTLYFVLSTSYFAFVVGCGQSGPARAPIQGKVTFGGQPLAAGRILFTPVAPNAGPATSAAVTNGEYTIPASEGPVVGTNRVEIEAQPNLGFAIDDEAAFAKRGGKPLPPNPIPPQYNRDSQLVVEVKPGEENTFNVDVPKSRHVAARPAY
jgi:hypothetical protein